MLKFLFGQSDEAEAEAHYNRGVALYNNGGRFAAALVELRAAAALGHGLAMFCVGCMYRDGDGVAKDVAESYEWFKRAAAAGNLHGMHNVAVHLRDGVPEAGVAPNRAEATRLMRQAAEGGHVSAMCTLGMCLHVDNKDDPEQVVWFRRAAEKGSKEAMRCLGYCYDNGMGGLEKNVVTAHAWYLEAAELGDPTAMFNLGVNHENGDGVEKNLATAAEWFERASKAGKPDAPAALERVKKLIADEQAAEQQTNSASSTSKIDAGSSAAAATAQSANEAAAKKQADDERAAAEQRARQRTELEAEEREIEARRLRKVADEQALEQWRLAAAKRDSAAAPPAEEQVLVTEEQPSSASTPTKSDARSKKGDDERDAKRSDKAPRREKKSAKAKKEKVEHKPSSSYGEFVPAVGVASPAAPAPPNAHQIDHNELRLGAALGQGAFGVVLRAQWQDRDVAVKQILNKVDSAKAVRELTREIEVMAAIAPHKNVVRLFGWTRFSDGTLGAVMVLCSHGPLVRALYGAHDQVLRWTAAGLASMALDAARGLAHLHAHNVVHRDVAARNVMPAGDDEGARVGKVADFGLSRVNDHESVDRYSDPDKGPFKWMAPEQMGGEHRYSAASDVFSFGVLLLEIFARSAPWPEMNPLLAGNLVVAGERAEIPTSVPAAMAQLIRECWAHEASARPTMADCVSRIVAHQ